MVKCYVTLIPLEVFLTQPLQCLGRGWLSGAHLGQAEGLLSGVQDEPRAADAQMTPSRFGCSLLASPAAFQPLQEQHPVILKELEFLILKGSCRIPRPRSDHKGKTEEAIPLNGKYISTALFGDQRNCSI